MNDHYPDGTDRSFEINILRGKALQAGLLCLADNLHAQGTYDVAPVDAFDEACKALADKLREPEKCYACGQEKTS